MKNLKEINIVNLSSVLTGLIFLILISFQTEAVAQKITLEEIKKICKDSPKEDQIKVSVVRFSSRMHTRDRNQLGDELATMLTNALFEVNCFRVLESASKLDDFNAEYDLNNSGYTDNTGSSKGNMLGAQAIISGEITEYGEGESSGGAFGVKVGKQKARVGFVLKVLDVNTREVLFSESVNMEGTASGFKGLSAFRLNIAGSTDKSKALNDAVEKAIIKAAEILAKSKDSWGIEARASELNKNKTIGVIVKGIGFGDVVSFSSKLQSISDVTDVSKTFKDGAGTFGVTTALSGEELAFAILDKIGSQYEITEVNESVVKLKKN